MEMISKLNTQNINIWHHHETFAKACNEYCVVGVLGGIFGNGYGNRKKSSEKIRRFYAYGTKDINLHS